MITCSYCQTPNEEGGQFCINCGKNLPAVKREVDTAVVHTAERSNTAGRQLAVATGQVLIGALLVWVLRAILLTFSFARGTIFPQYSITVEAVITLLAYVAIIAMLLSYAGSLRTYWPRAFPQAASATTALTAIVYVIVLALAYSAISPFLMGILSDSYEVFRWVNIFLSIVVIALLAWAVKVIYDALPQWLNSIRFNETAVPQGATACLKCGHIYPDDMNYCGNCGQQMK